MQWTFPRRGGVRAGRSLLGHRIWIVALALASLHWSACTMPHHNPAAGEIRRVLESQVTVAAAEHEVFGRNEELPTGEAAILARRNARLRPGWKKFIAELREDDELWTYRQDMGGRCIERGFAIVREGKIVSWHKHLNVYVGDHSP